MMMRKFRRILRYLILAVGLWTTSWLAAGFWSNYQLWRANLDDRSVAELYLDGCWIDGSLGAGAIGLTLLIFAVLRPPKQTQIN